MWNLHLNTFTKTKVNDNDVSNNEVLFKVIPTGCIICAQGRVLIWNSELAEATETSVIETLQKEGKYN
jgi:hypothetical protein